MSDQIAESIEAIPGEILALLSDLAKIRVTVLENAPHCLPAIAPFILEAEEHVHSLWQC